MKRGSFTTEATGHGCFLIGMERTAHEDDHFKAYRYLIRDEARQLRDELTAFLGEPKCQRCAANEHLLSELPGLRDANEALRRDNADLTTQNQRLRQANFRLQISTVPMDVYGELKRKHAELNDVFEESNRQYTELRERYKNLQSESGKHIVKSVELNAENEKLRQRVASLEKDAANLREKDQIISDAWWRQAKSDAEKMSALQEENARLKVDLMNARAGTTTITIGDWSRITGS